MDLKAGQVDAFVRHPPPGLRAALLYGPDLGLVRERSTALMRTVVSDLADPFRVAELSAAALGEDHARLFDEAAALALTGGRRVVRVSGAGDRLAPLFASFLADTVGDALVVVEGHDLNTRSKLVDAFKASANGAALPCYADEGDALEAVIESTLKAARLTPTPEALAYLADNLGGDRMLTRSELQKLILYAGPGAFQVTLADAEACIGDSSTLSLDDVADAVAGGALGALDDAIGRSFIDGQNPTTLLRAAQRHFQRLHGAALQMTAGLDAKTAAKKQGIMWKREAAFLRQLRAWPASRVLQALDILTDAEIDCKSTGSAAEALCRHALLRIARAAQASARG